MTKIEKLELYLQTVREAPFAWGVHDCCTFAADWVHVVTGEDPMEGLRGYRDEDGARAAVAGVGGLDRGVTEGFGGQRRLVTPLLAQRGDVVLFEPPTGPTMGICIGAQIACIGPEGVAHIGMHHAVAAWRVE